MKVSIFWPMEPPTVTHQEQAVRVVRGKPVFYEPDRLKAARQRLTALAAAAAPERPLRGPVQLCVKWCFGLDKGRCHRDGDWKCTRPDTDNLQKLLKDCLTAAHWWKDDAQVCQEMVEKFWAELPGIHLSAEELEVSDDG